MARFATRSISKPTAKRSPKRAKKTKQELARLGFSFTDSKANFIFAKSNKLGGKELYLALKAKGVLVRHFDAPGISDYNRITVGSAAQMEKLIRVLEEIL